MYLEKHLKTIELMEYELRHKLKEYDLNLSDGFKDEKEWYAKSQNVKMVFGNNIVIDYQEGTYIVFKEKNLNFNSTEGRIKVNELDEYNLVFEGKNLDKGNIKVFIVEYNRKKEKLKINSYSLNTKKNLKFEKDTRFVRIAFRTEGTGTSIISNFDFYMKKKSKKISQVLTDSKNKPIKKIKDMNVIFIADEFTTRSFEPEFNVIKVSPENWQKEVEGKDIDFFFCESAWQGNDGKWINKVGSRGPRNNTVLLELVKWCKDNGIKTVFWNKEDPVHYNAFIDTAVHFDYVFTTDKNSIVKYKEMGCKNVEDLPFAAQLKYHNPIEKYNRKNKVVFAGSYYGEKFPERTKIMNEMLEISKDFGLDIFDRNYNNPNNVNQFPEEFKKNIIGDLVGDEIEEAYKGYKVSINVNSVTDSPTMFARRVFELLACNTPVISSGSIGIIDMFKGKVVASQDKEVLRDELELLLKDSDYYQNKQLECLREILEHHTYKHRVEKILNKIQTPFLISTPKISTITVIRNRNEAENILNTLNTQNYKNINHIFILDYFEDYLNYFNKFNDRKSTAYLLEYISNYRNISEIIKSDYIIPMAPNKKYNLNYIKDFVLAIDYSKFGSIITSNKNEKMYTYIDSFKLQNSMIPISLLTTFKSMDFLNKMQKNFEVLGWKQFGVDILNINNN